MELNDFVKKALLESVNETMETLFSMTPRITEEESGLSRNYNLLCSIGIIGRLEGNILMTFMDAGAVLGNLVSNDQSPEQTEEIS